MPEPGIIQVWSGLTVRTQPGWSSLVRPPINLPRSAGYDAFEGVVETDRWYGPLFINIRLTRTSTPVEFDPEAPLLQLQPIRRDDYRNEVLNKIAVRELSEMRETDWAAYWQTVVEPAELRRPRGMHAAEVRKGHIADQLAIRCLQHPTA